MAFPVLTGRNEYGFTEQIRLMFAEVSRVLNGCYSALVASDLAMMAVRFHLGCHV